MPAIDLSEVAPSVLQQPYGVVDHLSAGYVYAITLFWQDMPSYSIAPDSIFADVDGTYALDLGGRGFSQGEVLGVPFALDRGILEEMSFFVDGAEMLRVTDMGVDLGAIWPDLRWSALTGDENLAFDVLVDALTDLGAADWTIGGTSGDDEIVPLAAWVLGFEVSYSGNDTFDGRGGNDFLDGGAGRDTLIGGAGRDTLYGGRGNDRLFGGVGDDTLSGEAGRDRLSGGDGADALFGGAGGDMLGGGRGKDVLYGDGGRDVLLGGRGNDMLFGDAGNDRLTGGAGRDTLIGGRGGDVFVFAVGSGHDVIEDFSVRQGDGLDFAAIGDVQAHDMENGAGIHFYWQGGSVDVLGIDAGDLPFVLA